MILNLHEITNNLKKKKEEKKIFACITQILYIMKQHKNTHLLILYQQQESLLDCKILTKIS